MIRQHKHTISSKLRLALASLVAVSGLLAAQLSPAVVYATCSAGCDASLSASPSSKTYEPGDTVTVSIYVNTGGHSVNAVQADFTYTSSRLTYKSIDASASAFGINASSTGGGGSVSIARGSISPVSGSTQLVAKVKFTAKSNNDGKAYISFSSSSTVADSSSNDDILGSKNGATYTIATPAPSSGGSSGGSTGGSPPTTTTKTPTTTTTTTKPQTTTTTKQQTDKPATTDKEPVAEEPEAPAVPTEVTTVQEESAGKSFAPVAAVTIGIGALLAAAGLFVALRLFARHRRVTPYQDMATDGSVATGASHQPTVTVMPGESSQPTQSVTQQHTQTVSPNQPTETPASAETPAPQPESSPSSSESSKSSDEQPRLG